MSTKSSPLNVKETGVNPRQEQTILILLICTSYLSHFFILVQEAGVTLADHHSTSESFIKHMEKEVSVFLTQFSYISEVDSKLQPDSYAVMLLLNYGTHAAPSYNRTWRH